jgi:hypothetical protein
VSDELDDTVEIPDDRGAIDRAMSKLLGRNWQPRLGGIVAMACGIAMMVPGLPPDWARVLGGVMAAAAGGGLAVAKGYRVSGPPLSANKERAKGPAHE